jgi:hypothetical protein
MAENDSHDIFIYQLWDNTVHGALGERLPAEHNWYFVRYPRIPISS